MREYLFSLRPERGTVEIEAGFGNTGIDAHPTPVWRLYSVPCVTGILYHLPAAFDKQAFLRVDVFRLARRDPEKERIEVGKAFEKASPLAVTLAGFQCRLGIAVIETIQWPAIMGKFSMQFRLL